MSQTSSRVVYLGPLEDHPDEEPSMRFRLTYEGELKATQGEPRDGQINKMADHKQTIRKEFHRQLKYLWETNQVLKDHVIYRTDLVSGRSAPNDAKQFPREPFADNLPLIDAVAQQYEEYVYRFVPLVREDLSLLCSLDILFLLRDIQGSVIGAGDLDNRIKTLIDALRRPRNANELRGNETPADGETPFFCLLEDDRLVTQLAVDTDRLLDPPNGNRNEDRRQVKVIITVELKPYHATPFNLLFS